MDNEQRNVYSSPHWKWGPDSAGLFTIPVRALNVIWGNDPYYWQAIELSEEEIRLFGFKEAILLHQVNWIEVTGKLDIPSFNSAMHTTHTLYYIVKFMPDAFAIEFKLKINNTQEIISPKLKLERYKEKPDEWHEIPGGKPFIVDNEILVTNIEFGMFEVETDWWKGGMALGGVKLKPGNRHATELK